MSEERFQELMHEASQLTDTPTKVAILEEAAREADHLNDAEHGFECRMDLVHAATYSGQREKAMVAYSWCLGHYDRHRDDIDDYDEYSLLWSYKWIVGKVAQFPQISLEQINHLQDDMMRRYTEVGYGPRASYQYRYQNLVRMGEIEAARGFLDLWKSVPRDEMADCEACECDTSAELHFETRDDKQALKIVEPILNGRLSCNTIPHHTYASVMMPLTRLGRVDEAHRLQQRGYRMISRNRDYLPDIAEHMLFLLHHQEFNKPTRMFAKHFSWALETAVPGYRFDFYLASAVLMEALAGRSNRKRKLRLSEQFPLKTADDSYKPGELADWLWQETHNLAERFNARNGNDYYSHRIQSTRELAALD